MTLSQILDFLKDGDHFLGFIVVLSICFGGIVQIIKAIKGKKTDD